MAPLYLVYLLIVNLLALAAFVLDKRAAQQGSALRTSERQLLGLMLVGGVIGGWMGMVLFRHKTQHTSFWVVLWVATVLHIGLVWAVL
jgi:uncharacterized membrane protein YsdA (DUF1294 family)